MTLLTFMCECCVVTFLFIILCLLCLQYCSTYARRADDVYNRVLTVDEHTLIASYLLIKMNVPDMLGARHAEYEVKL